MNHIPNFVDSSHEQREGTATVDQITKCSLSRTLTLSGLELRYTKWSERFSSVVHRGRYFNIVHIFTVFRRKSHGIIIGPHKYHRLHKCAVSVSAPNYRWTPPRWPLHPGDPTALYLKTSAPAERQSALLALLWRHDLISYFAVASTVASKTLPLDNDNQITGVHEQYGSSNGREKRYNWAKIAKWN